MEKVVLGLGSNKGDSLNILSSAVGELAGILGSLSAAAVYLTEPMHRKEQNKFYNTAVSGFYTGTPEALLKEINAIEEKFGRSRKDEQRWGARTLDIDILLFGDRLITAPPGEPEGLTVPHPRLKERRFALEPLLEIMPAAAEPGTGKLYSDICSGLPPQGVVKTGALPHRR